MNPAKLLLLVAVLAAVVLAHEGHHHHDHDHDHDHDEHASGDLAVVTLTSDNFEEKVSQWEISLIEFFAPWCGHCKQLKPQYEMAAKQLKGKIPLAAVDCTTDRDLCERFAVRGFPTMKIFRSSAINSPGDYQGGRRADEIVSYMRKQTEPAYKVIKSSELSEIKSSEPIVIVGYFASTEDAEAQQFIQSANALRNDYTFVIISDPEAASVTPPAIKLLKADGDATFDKTEITKENIGQFIRAEAFPLVGEIGPENYEKYLERGLPLVWVFIDPSADITSQVIEVATSVAGAFKGRISMVKLDGVRWRDHAKNFGLSGSTPGIVAEDKENNKNYVFPESNSITVELLTAHVQGFLDKTLQPTIKSEEIPATNDEPVKVIVGKSFQEMVIDNDKDVFVEFYAPWCGHCKQLAPKWDKLAKMFVDNPKVMIGKVDSTANDVPGVEISGFPTIYLFPAGNKQTPMMYNGDRTEAAMAKWLKENGSTFKSGSDPSNPDAVHIPSAHDEL